MMKKGGTCEMLTAQELAKENYYGSIAAIKGTSKEMDCKQEGFYYETKGYRKIPGDMCYAGVDLEPVKLPCGPMSYFLGGAWKNFAIMAVLAAILYYGWPIIDMILLMLPFPDPGNSLQSVKSYAGAAAVMVSAIISSPDPNNNTSATGYSGVNRLANNSDSSDDSSDDEETGKPGDKIKLSSSDDDDGPGSSEMIEMGGSSGNEPSNDKKLIPRLAGPK